jgi:predicted TIM-barrel fold metal-dependent hydrolase
MEDKPELTRRALLGAGATAAGAATLAGPLDAAARKRRRRKPATTCAEPGLLEAPPGGRIDLHAHHVPEVYRAALLRAGMVTIGGYPTPVWTPERAMLMMDNYGIQMQVLSLSDPGVSFLRGADAATLARQVNEYTASLIERYPKRFGGFAVLPLPDIDASIRELEYALGTLGLDGVGLLTSYDGTNVATPGFERLWAAINQRKAFVFMHPATLAADDKPTSPLPDFLVEFTFETTRTIALMLNLGLTTRHRDVRVQFAHAGGAFPFLSWRVGVLTEGGVQQFFNDRPPEAVNGVSPVAATQGLYYDTALAPAPPSMRSVLEITDVSHIVFGSDWPFTELLFLRSGDPWPQLSRTFNEQQRHAIERANALHLLPTVAARLGAAVDAAVSASLKSVRSVRARGGRRAMELKLSTAERVSLDAQITRRGKRVARKRINQVGPGDVTVRMGIPAKAGGGAAVLKLTLADAKGNSTAIRRSVKLSGRRRRRDAGAKARS